MISIALASYNGSKYIREQLDSILRQTYQNFELVICDDCSTDNTWHILQEYAQKDTRVKIYANEANIGFKKNFEKAISKCNGEYIAMSDQDDIWTNNHLEILLNNLGEYSISGGNAILVDKEGRSLNTKLNEVDKFLFFQSDKFLYRILFISDPIQGASMLMHKTFVQNCLPIPDGVVYHDAWFAACACFEHGINYTFDIINHYRQHDNNVTFSAHNKQTKGFFQGIVTRFKNTIKWLRTDRFNYVKYLKEKYGLNNEDFKYIFRIYNKIEAHKLLNFRDIKHLWKNYYFIKTTNTHRGFLKFIITLHLKKIK